MCRIINALPGNMWTRYGKTGGIHSITDLVWEKEKKQKKRAKARIRHGLKDIYRRSHYIFWKISSRRYPQSQRSLGCD
ncbi:uncharacterized protein PgNI_11566 [Pyricularia grisea]|uniref:Uncharacterized protein n=1 Tax=Pyricularia grisea TaxID=148305 RepID=A0A6P8ANA7_PYRGI|nr:uncharacterized protein PgNI_11566 [Pyricularia grisea]TLD03505.1 hypothetical protein PgNI_11566 [Pyricularia grisea]